MNNSSTRAENTGCKEHTVFYPGIKFRRQFNSREVPRYLPASRSAAPRSCAALRKRGSDRGARGYSEPRQTWGRRFGGTGGGRRKGVVNVCLYALLLSATVAENYLTDSVSSSLPGSLAPVRTTNISPQPFPSPPHSNTMPIEVPSFYERGASITFDQPTLQRGYLCQINEKLGQWISWEVKLAGGDPHLPTFVCVPSEHSLSCWYQP